MRRGLSLLELLLAIAVAGLLLGIALPPFAAARDRLAVGEEAWRIVAAHRRARIAAILQRRPVVLSIAADSIIMRAVAGPELTWREPGPSFRGVGLTGGPKDITFSPVGITTGVSNATFTLTRGNAVRVVIVSRLGRLRFR